MLERQNLIAKTPQRNKTSKLCILFLTSLIYLTIAAIVGWADKANILHYLFWILAFFFLLDPSPLPSQPGLLESAEQNIVRYNRKPCVLS